MRFLAIDPGNTQSAYALVDTDRRPLLVGKVPNRELLALMFGELRADRAAIEMVASYGMPVGAEVFETCVWIGRFEQQLTHNQATPTDRIKRLEVKLHHCHDSKAKDSNITQALVDRFAPDRPNRGKGTKAEPGWFYGFHSDIWQAYALAVYAADQYLLDQHEQPQSTAPASGDEAVEAGTVQTIQEALLP